MTFKMKICSVLSIIILNSFVANSELVQAGSEYGSYVNPNPRAYDKCDTEDLQKLSLCASDVLSKLDDCKPDDLACECCALQSMKQECYGLCPGNPSGNFLAVLYNDCESLNDVNACGLPFKKDDNSPAKLSKGHDADSTDSQKASKSKSKADSQEAASHDAVVVKSTIQTFDQIKNGHTLESLNSDTNDKEGDQDLKKSAMTKSSSNFGSTNGTSGSFNATSFNHSIFNSKLFLYSIMKMKY